MKTNRIIQIIAILVLLIGTSYNVSAESGSILISDENTTSYNYPTTTYTTGYQVNFSKFEFLNTSYNYLSNFRITGIGLAYGDYPFTFAHQFESSEFTIVGGGTGDGTIRYDANTTAIYYVFSSSSRVTGKVVELSIDNPLFQSNITTAGSVRTSDAPLSTSYPLGMRLIGSGSFIQIRYEDVVYGVRAYDYYQVDYPYAGYFRVNVTKNSDVNSRYIIHSETKNYSAETTYNKDNIVKALFVYEDGLYLNATLASGVYTKTLINSSGTTGYTPPTEQPTIDPLTGVGIVFDASEYAVGDIANISWQRTIDTPFGYQDLINLYSPNADPNVLCWDQTELCSELIVSPTDTGNVKALLSEVGTYNVAFERRLAVGAWGGREVLAADEATVGAETPSYILAPINVGKGQLFNVTYKIGWTVSSGTNAWVRSYAWNTDTNSYSDTYQSWVTAGVKGTEYNQSILVTQTGKHLIKLCDILQGCKASTTTEAFYNGSVPTTNITTSNISLDRSLYSYGDTMLVKVRVDNTNWTYRSITVDYHDTDEGIRRVQYNVQDQIQTIPLYISDLTFIGSGAATMELMAENETGIITLDTASFTLSNVDAEGYGLEVIGDPKCSKDITQIRAIVPTGEVASLNISADDARWNKNLVINGTKVINYKFPVVGTYYISLKVGSEVKRLIIKDITNCEAAVVVTPPTQVQTQEDITNLLGSNMFWAFVVIVGMMVAVGIEIKGYDVDAMIPMSVVGFLGVAAFTFVGWIPSWILVSIILVMVVVFSWTQVKNTGGG